MTGGVSFAFDEILATGFTSNPEDEDKDTLDVSVTPYLRYYQQSEADFYYSSLTETGVDGFDRIDGGGANYSSDYRLSKMEALTYGVRVAWDVRSDLTLDLQLERYEMNGLDSQTPASFFPTANVASVGAHSLSGQTITIEPTTGATNPAQTKVGEPFEWDFRASSHTMRSFEIEFDGGEQLPPGIVSTGPQSGIGTIGGIPMEAGEITLKITGYRFANLGGNATAPYFLVLNVAPDEEPPTPLEEFVATFWSGEDLNDPLLVGATADPDGDGISNVMEFVLDLDPTKPEAMPGNFGIDPQDPTRVRYEIPLNVAAGAVAVGFEEGGDLEADWQDVAAENVTRTDESIILSAPIDGAKFYRLKVVFGQG